LLTASSPYFYTTLSFLSFYYAATHHVRPSFPTRRSSDLLWGLIPPVSILPIPNDDASLKNRKGMFFLFKYFGNSSFMQTPYNDSYLSFISNMAIPSL